MTWNDERRDRDRGPCRSPEGGAGALELLAEWLRLPMVWLVYATELAAWTARGMRRVADEGVEGAFGRAMAPGESRYPGAGGAATVPVEGVEPEGGGGSARAPEIVNHSAVETAADSRSEETRPMPDMNLADDMVKLVRYTIVSIKRDEERILKRDEEIFDDNMTDDAFATWVISKHGDSQGLGSDDRKYLRVAYEVLGRWARQDRKYEKRQLEILEGIRKELG